MKSISRTARCLILASSLIALPAFAVDAGKAADGKPEAAAADPKKKEVKSPYLQQQPKQQQHNKHKNEKAFDKKDGSKLASEKKK